MSDEEQLIWQIVRAHYEAAREHQPLAAWLDLPASAKDVLYDQMWKALSWLKTPTSGMVSAGWELISIPAAGKMAAEVFTAMIDKLLEVK